MSLAFTHGGPTLTVVNVDAYNAELHYGEGFIGDRASNRAFGSVLDEIQGQLSAGGEDPIGEEPSEDISKRKLDKLLVDGDPEAAGIVHGASEAFAQEFATVIRRFLKPKEWRDTQRIVVVQNDAVAQNLSQAPFMHDVERWGVMTIGIGLGNARFTNRPSN
jgi:hypothetical protein